MVWKAYIYSGNLDELMEFAVSILRPIIRQFEEKEWIKGFNFSFYSTTIEEPHLSVRLDLKKKHEQHIKKELNQLHMKPKTAQYAEQDKIAKHYELGSRWAFLLQELVDKKRFQKEWIKEDTFPLAIHALCNSLFLGYYEEIKLHLKALAIIGMTLGNLDDIKQDLKTINQKCYQWFFKIE